MGKYTQAIELQRRAIRLRKEAAGLEKRAGWENWLSNATQWLQSPANQQILLRFGLGGATGLGVYAASGLFDPKKKYRWLRAVLAAIPAFAAGTKGFDYLQSLRPVASPAQTGEGTTPEEESEIRHGYLDEKAAKQQSAETRQELADLKRKRQELKTGKDAYKPALSDIAAKNQDVVSDKLAQGIAAVQAKANDPLGKKKDLAETEQRIIELQNKLNNAEN